jgi:hypothetical protein
MFNDNLINSLKFSEHFVGKQSELFTWFTSSETLLEIIRDYIYR